MSMMERRSYERKKNRVSDEDVQRWLEDEEFERFNRIDMEQMEAKMSAATGIERSKAVGNVPAERPEGVFRGMSVQLNNMATARVRNRKARQLTYIMGKYEVHFVGLGEIGVNWLLARKLRLLSLLPDLKQQARTMTAHNIHERIALHQQGGVGTIAIGELLNYYKKGSNDFRGLGRWTSFIIQAVQGHRLRVVQGYGVLPRRSQEFGSVDQQHLRYIQLNGFSGVRPRDLFESDLIWQLQVWRAMGDRIILMMDVNCHVLTGRLSRALTHESIGLREITKDHLGHLCPNTHSRGSEQIDGVWATTDITITAVKWLSYEESPGDHRACVFDFTTLSAIGSHERKIVLPGCRRLISSNPGAVEAYMSEMDRQFKIHRIEERMQAIDEETKGLFPIPDEYQVLSDALDRQTAEIQLHCEKRCRVIYRIDSAFTPDTSIWHKRKRIFKELIRMHQGRKHNAGVLCKRARLLGIVAPKQWTIEECQYGIAVCKAWKRKLRKYTPAMRFEHLQYCLIDAEANGDKERAKAIRTMMTREESASMWQQLSFAFKDNGGRSNAVTRVERIEEGVTVEYTEKEEIEQVVFEMTQDRFTLASSSPLCNGLLGEQLGYIADTEIARQILEGEYTAPPGVSDATIVVLEEIGRVAKEVTLGSAKISVVPEEFSEYWQGVNERTSSSTSKVHFGHYKVAAMSKRYSAFFARKLSFIARTGWAPSRWGNGMNVLLEKIAGIALVNKQRAILLFEADSNMFNRLLLSNRPMELAREHGIIPPEQYAERQSDGQDGAWLKRLFADVSRQMRLAMGIISADAETCYDRIAHAFASLVYQAVGVSITALMVMLLSIQHMKFYLRTGLGESVGYMTAVLGSIIQGLCQGNTAAPAGWSLISAILLMAYKRFGHGARFTTAISRQTHETAGVLYVDDVDLFIMNSALITRELWEEAARSTACWSELLTIPGGSGKGEKCFGYLIDYEWDQNGHWQYAPVPEMELEIILPDGSREGIALLPANAARVTLGVCTSPDGDDLHHLTKPGQARDKWRSVATRANVWLDRLKNAHLPPKYSWVSYRLQLWSSLRYGLGTLSAPLGQMGEVTTNFAFRALPYLGVNRNIRSEWRYLHNSFGGVGLFSMATEATIGRVNLFLQHWDMPSPIGNMLRASMELLHLEVGCAGCPLNEPYHPMGPITTHCWLRSFWEVVDKFRLALVIDYPDIPLPRLNDLTITTIAIRLGFGGSELESINRCRLACCCIFLSDLVSANGRFLDPMRGQEGVDYSNSSSYSFPREKPCPADWVVWRSLWARYCMADGSIPVTLGKWLHSSHRRWEWFYCAEEQTLLQWTQDTLWAYHPCIEYEHTRSTRSNNVYGRTGEWLHHDMSGYLPATVQVNDDCVHLLSAGHPQRSRTQQDPEEFWAYLRSWGGEWLWDHIYTPFGLDAVVDAIDAGTAVYVTDGSYSRKIRSEIDGAGYMIYCTARRKVVLKGSFYEHCVKAGSYRGELLGLLAVHLLILAVEKFYSLDAGPRGLVGCDNLGGLNKSREKRRKIPSGSKHADILRSLRRVHASLKGSLRYKHVYGHQDRRKTWAQMTLLERLNSKCDGLAKGAVSRGILECPRDMSKARQLLPMETAAIFHDNNKISGECGAEIRFHIGLVEARAFYITQLGWYAATFDNVDWKSRDKCLSPKPDMFKMWIFKQSSKFCASGRNMGRWFNSEHTSCPNCGLEDEDSSHLMHCGDAGRFGLFREEVNKLTAWLQSSHTDPDLARILPIYLLNRGTVSMSSIEGLPREFLRFASSQDIIGWDNFLLGMVSMHLRPIQYSYLLTSPSMLNVDDWMSQFIGKLLHLTHGQWIYRNISKYHDKLGSIRKTERRELLLEIDRLIHVAPEDVPEESKFLLEVDFARLRKGELTTQHYWVHAVKAAVVAGRRRTFLQRRRLRRRRVDAATQPPIPFAPSDNPVDLPPPDRSKRGHAGAGSVDDKSNKRRRPD